MHEKNAVFLAVRLGGFFKRVWEGFWEAKILDFRIFFDVFSKSFLKRVPEGEKIEPRSRKRHRKRYF